MISRMLSTSKGSVIKITDNAWNRMNHVIKNRRARGFIFSAESGGCNGFNYKLTLFKYLYEIENMENTQKTSLKATKIENNGVEVYIEPLSEMFLLGIAPFSAPFLYFLRKIVEIPYKIPYKLVLF